MFSADLSWVDPDTEKVGERRERISKERPLSSAAPSFKSSGSSKSSVQDDKELWWPASLKKAKAQIPTRRPRPDSSRSGARTRKPSISVPQPVEPESPTIRDPILQPGWTYSSTLHSILPSGASIDPPEYEVPELEGDFSSRRTGSSGSRSSNERQWGMRDLRSPGKIRVIDEVHEVQQLSPTSYIARTTRRSSESVDPKEVAPASSPKDNKKKKRPYSVRIEGCLDLEKLALEDQPRSTPIPEPGLAPGTIPERIPEPLSSLAANKQAQQSYASGLSDANLVAWRPPSEWDIVLPGEMQKELQENKQLPPIPDEDIGIGHSSTVELTRFQKFIRRMESAGPKIILDRMKEEWNEPIDDDEDEELTLEKQLWVLTAFQLQNLGSSRVAPKPKSDTGKILELYGNLSEVFQLSAMHPRQKVHYLTTKPQQPIPLPGNVSYLTVAQPGMVPFPYPECSFSHIRASTLPSLVPSAKLPLIFGECYRLLAPGGMLEIRIMDAAPVRKTAGPKMRAWIEDRLSLNLERLFRCSKPCTLIPGWVTDAGFDLAISRLSMGSNNLNMKLPCAFNGKATDVDTELSAMVGRALWRDIWGEFVDDIPGEPRWWWEDEEVMQECRELNTVFECGSIHAFKT
ncbi:hypothetical protein BDV96DRAFT_671612 [Lophiotrema nucula]|uniref:Methyltransferase type 11 domain-containing protein n=1 Tax=Lophiotrema nucula TaxID=690887 RepID=A0A6A5ZQL4_9PLEO|nr:hypothetical protein BDV96DRAFT_671612 [Lophiotrema nucula]